MIKTKIIETTEKYDKDGKLVEKITREETSEDDESRSYIATTPWITPNTIPHKEETTFPNSFGYIPLGYPYKKEANEIKITC